MAVGQEQVALFQNRSKRHPPVIAITTSDKHADNESTKQQDDNYDETFADISISPTIHAKQRQRQRSVSNGDIQRVTMVSRQLLPVVKSIVSLQLGKRIQQVSTTQNTGIIILHVCKERTLPCRDQARILSLLQSVRYTRDTRKMVIVTETTEKDSLQMESW